MQTKNYIQLETLERKNEEQNADSTNTANV